MDSRRIQSSPTRGRNVKGRTFAKGFAASTYSSSDQSSNSPLHDFLFLGRKEMISSSFGIRDLAAIQIICPPEIELLIANEREADFLRREEQFPSKVTDWLSPGGKRDGRKNQIGMRDREEKLEGVLMDETMT
ncbi:hypothetical protein Fcan01_25134 [Folsomia candida]|uniref:Uncharacterized protein n=1 Tax=Folsomia candida TaxID=158441 RepID=A0A226D4I6_FOLCA|nr:hypothetical protein Fcan01_25134 [Folsomia candida]